MSEERFFDYQRTFAQPVLLQPDKTALLIIDMQYHDASPDQGANLAFDRLDPGCCDYYNERVKEMVIPTIRKLLDGFRSEGMDVIYLTIGSDDRELSDMPERHRLAFRELERASGVPDILWSGNPAFSIREEIAPEEGELVLNKTTFGAFNSSNLEQILLDRGIESLVITGVSTNCCVETTSRDAADRGFGCVIVDEGTADYDQTAQDATLRAFHFNFGRVMRTAEDVMSAINEAAVGSRNTGNAPAHARGSR